MSRTMHRKLHSLARSPFARKVRIALLEKALPFEIEAVDLAARTPAFLSVSPLGKIPAFVDEDGTAVFDSTVIVEYLDDRYPEPSLLGATWAERLLNRALDELGDTVADQGVAMYQARLRGDTPAEERALALAKKALAELDRRTQDGRWPARFGVGDVAVLSALGYFELRHGRATLEEAPAVLQKAAAWADRPSVAATVPVL
jgi:glutathione S-transferase